MKKLLLVILFLLVSNNVYANGKILKSGFITKSASVEKGIDIKDPKNKIVIIYNHGQNSNDTAMKSECVWVNQIRNQASLVDEEIDGKKIYAKEIYKNPEKYFTQQVLQALDEIAQREFSYGTA